MWLGGCLGIGWAVGWSMAGRAGANTPVLGIGWAVGVWLGALSLVWAVGAWLGALSLVWAVVAWLGGCLPKRGAGWWSATGRAGDNTPVLGIGWAVA